MTSHLEGAHQGFIHAHHAAGVVELSAVVWSREQSHQLPLGKELIAIFYHLGASDTQELTVSIYTEINIMGYRLLPAVMHFMQNIHRTLIT